MNKPNRLINEKSPYLLQHAYNPVDWYPWSDEAFKRAKDEDKPIFLSIGYSTCHWCHVMEKESFEDEKVAQLMNDTFICIKVDREERPDIDGIYMSVCQMMTGGGGWPLTILITPDKKPFFSGTYFPRKNRFGRIGMLELVPRIKDVWLNKREEILKSADEITKTISTPASISNIETLDESALDNAFEQLKRRFDFEMGGFGIAPKFPSPHNLLFLLRYWKRGKSQAALNMVETTLQKMYMGGIYDHIGFGFARYSTDKNWLVPHFEKMLYDQAMLALAYTEAFQATKKIFYKNVAEEILEYVLRDMTQNEGGFYSAEDADSEGEEGKFYLWDYDELLIALNKDEFDMAVKIFNVEKDGNWIDESKGLMDGTNILHLKKTFDELTDEFGLEFDKLEKKINVIKKKLFEYRKKRIHPHKDDKILADWNGLMISAFAKAGSAFNEPKYIAAAEKAYRFIEMNLSSDNGKLLHRFREEEAGLTAHIDDYAYMIKASIDLYETTFNPDYLSKAILLNEIALHHFWCKESGGFYFTADYNEQLIARQKEIYDGAIPSGNSIQLLNLIKLARMTLNSELENIASSLIDAFSAEITRNPSYYTQFLCGLDFIIGPSYEVIISSGNDDKAYLGIRNHLRSEFYPNIVLINKTKETSEKLENLIPALINNKPIDNKTTIYVCKNFICNLPVFSSAEISELIN